jgi:ribosomal protein S18 acetylase RimI-like enzyme
MVSSLSLRSLQPQDAVQYQQLRLRALRENPQAFTSDAEQEQARPLLWSHERLAASNATFFGHVFEGNLVSMVGLEVPTRKKEAHVGHLIGMYVSPEFAGRGLARALVSACLDDARQRGLRAVKLSVTSSNSAALNLYLSCGFRRYGEEAQAVYVDGAYYAKSLLKYDLNLVE